MTSISCEEIARRVLDECIAGRPPDVLPSELLAEPCNGALFGILVEGLSDRFEPRLCDVYVRLLSQVLTAPLRSRLGRCSDVTEPRPPGSGFCADLARYERVRKVRLCQANPRRVVVLSRVTLGADVAVTSVLMNAAKCRFPAAEILFAGPTKNYEMFAGDPRIRHAPVEYRRGALNDRLAVLEQLIPLAQAADSLVLDPDSRLTQLGLLPVCPEERYCFFESRAYGSETTRSLPSLAADWAEETLEVAGAKPFVALADPPEPGNYIAISLGVGGNPAKRIPDPFERELLRRLSGTGLDLYIDRGAGGEEAERVTRAAEHAKFWEGSFAGFARIIAGSRLYVGYDSAGQHVAAACGVPLITIFAGFPSERMYQRWRPSGERSTVVRVDNPDPGAVLAGVEAALQLF